MPPFNLHNDLLQRFLRYVQIDTTANPQAFEKPSSSGQWELLKLLEAELRQLGCFEVELLSTGYLLAYKKGKVSQHPPLALLAHVDTSPDAPGAGVKPLVHVDYHGQVIQLKDGLVIDPSDDDYLASCLGDTIITSDGNTLLGADDKAGVAILMGYATLLAHNPETPHPDLEFVFTTDEEIGRGVENFPFDKVRARRGLTVDGGKRGELEDECYNAWAVDVECVGKSHHPGTARGKLVNAAAMAAHLVSMLPRSESPEATDGRYGCLWCNNLNATIEKAELTIYVRDFVEEQCERRIDLIRQAAKVVELAFPGGKVTVKERRQYRNMKPFFDQDPEFINRLVRAMEEVGVRPLRQAIRGGTDGARLSEQGLLCPNLFAGGANFHSRLEWVPLKAMEDAVRVLERLGSLCVL
jgi:tripeptide aminopeptidase